MAADSLAIPLLSVSGVIAWLAVLGRVRNGRHRQPNLRYLVLVILAVAVLLAVSSAFYLGAPLWFVSAVVTIARVVLLATALVLLLRA